MFYRGDVRICGLGISENVDVISISIGGPYGREAARKAYETADAAGISVVAASGNSGMGRVGFSAGFETVIAVGAVNTDFERARFSQYGPNLDIGLLVWGCVLVFLGHL